MRRPRMFFGSMPLTANSMHALRMLLQELLERDRLDAADGAGVVVVDLVGELAAGDAHLLRHSPRRRGRPCPHAGCSPPCACPSGDGRSARRGARASCRWRPRGTSPRGSCLALANTVFMWKKPGKGRPKKAAQCNGAGSALAKDDCGPEAAPAGSPARRERIYKTYGAHGHPRSGAADRALRAVFAPAQASRPDPRPPGAGPPARGRAPRGRRPDAGESYRRDRRPGAL